MSKKNIFDFFAVGYHLHAQRLGKWYAKFRNGEFHPSIVFVQISSIYQKQPRRLETGIKDGFEETELKFPLGIFHREKQDYLLRCFIAPGNFLLERPKKACYIYPPTGFSGNFL